MRNQASSNLGNGLRLSFWPVALIGIVVIKAVLSLYVKPGSFVLSYSGISYFLLLSLAGGLAIRNAIQNTLRGRAFWVCIAIAYGLWALHQCITLYYELWLQIDVPDSSIADPALFLHIIPLMAAVVTVPHGNRFEHKPHLLNSLLLLLFWGFLYCYVVFPYQYFPNAATYAVRFDILYLVENVALVLVIGSVALRELSPWKQIFLHLLGASALYALSSTFANLAIDSEGYVNGRLYGLGLTASVCWFVWIPLHARRIKGEETAERSEKSQSSRGSAWVMLFVVMVSVPIIWELFRRNESIALVNLRLLVAIIAILCLASVAYIKEYLAKRELDADVGLANDTLRLAMQASGSAGWNFDVKSGRNVWLGDLQNVFGIPSDTYVTTTEEFIGFVHPDDREKVSKSIANSREHQKPYAAEFRVVRPDGTIRWLAARGKFYYAKNGTPLRMIGVSLDITERKLADDALSLVNRRVIEAEERERDRIARDLHEDVGQRLALLAIAIEQLKNDSPHQNLEHLDRMDGVWKKAQEILTDVKATAHELYSPRLEYLGLASVMRTFCEEFGERKRVEIDFRSHGLSGPVAPELSICLFRVLQEALHNAVAHSRVHKFSVHLWGESDGIHLKVSDSGAGFDPRTARSDRGLGLIRIEQRVKLVEGMFSIDSQPEKGTSVHVSVPSRPRPYLRDGDSY